MLRQRGICYARCNSLIRNFSSCNCSLNVKVKLFKTFCCIMYCCQIWSPYKKGTVRKLQVGYNHAFRRSMKYDRTCSASGMFVANNVMSFNEILRKSLYNFKQRVTKSNNIIVNHVYNFTRATSTIWKNFDRIYIPIGSIGECVSVCVGLSFQAYARRRLWSDRNQIWHTHADSPRKGSGQNKNLPRVT